MTLQGVDALHPPSGAALNAAGKAFVCVYLKQVTSAQLADFRTHGVAQVLIFESTGTDFTGGAAQGAADARTAQAQMAALSLLPQPVYFAIDAGTSDYSGVNAYLDGVASVIGLANTGVYGSASVCTNARNHANFYWQTYAWSAGVICTFVHLYQYLNGTSVGGATVDLDRTIVSDTHYGQISDPSPVKKVGVEMFWIKDPSSALCIAFDGAFGIGLPDMATLSALQAAGVPELSVSQEFFNSIPMSAPIPSAVSGPAGPAGAQGAPGATAGIPDGALVLAGGHAAAVAQGGQTVVVYEPSFETAPVNGQLSFYANGQVGSAVSISLTPGAAQDVAVPGTGPVMVEFSNLSQPPKGQFARALVAVI